MTVVLVVSAAVFGLIVGSFLNVCIYRLPRSQSIVHPRSHCPACKHQISWYENIPLLSYTILRGKCRYCRRLISPRYPIVELLTAVLSVVILLRFPSPVHYVAFFLLLSAPLLVITFIDLEHFLIPDVITIPGIVVGVGVHLYLESGTLAYRLFDSMMGILVGGGILFLLSWLYERIRGQIGLGMGDVKLAAMLGAFFGWRAVIFLLLISSVIGTLVGLVYLTVSRQGLRQAIPYGPFLAFAAWIYLFYGSAIIDWYLSLTRNLYSLLAV